MAFKAMSTLSRGILETAAFAGFVCCIDTYNPGKAQLRDYLKKKYPDVCERMTTLSEGTM